MKENSMDGNYYPDVVISGMLDTAYNAGFLDGMNRVKKTIPRPVEEVAEEQLQKRPWWRKK